MKTIFKKQVVLQLEKGKNARHLTFEIELREEAKSGIDWETLQEIKNPLTLSICGATHKRGCACQKLKEILTYRGRVKPQDLNIFDFICKVWKKYHLNTMKAGTKTQTLFLINTSLSKSILWASNYDIACDKLAQYDLLFDRGYKYGTGWLVEQIPSEIIDQLKAL